MLTGELTKRDVYSESITSVIT
jgi:hypothetical protein